MLTEGELKIVNRLIRKIYTVDNSRLMRREVLAELKKVIHFKVSAFSLGSIKNSRVYLVDPVISSDFDKSLEVEFFNQNETRYHIFDYAGWIFFIPESVVYRDTDLVNNELRMKTPYYTDYLLKYDLPYMGGISIASENNFLGALTFYKSKESGDFTEKDLYILNLIQPHLQDKMMSNSQKMQEYKRNISFKLKTQFHLTDREIEIMGYVYNGYSTEEISKRLFIAQNTTKKHLSNIYQKLGLTGKMQIIKFIKDNDITNIWQ